MKPEDMKNQMAKIMFIVGMFLFTITGIATLFMVIDGANDYSNVQVGTISTVLLLGFSQVIELLTEIRDKMNK